jgi:hypothetical protein
MHLLLKCVTSSYGANGGKLYLAHAGLGMAAQAD